MDGSNWHELARANRNFDPGVPQRLGVAVNGDRITVLLGGETVIAHSDSTYHRGGVGLRVVDACAVFSDLIVERAE
jgi:hypothetical protein